MSIFYDMIKGFFPHYQVYPELAIYGAVFTTFAIIVLFSMILFFITRTILERIIGKLIKRTKGNWDDLLYSNRFFQVLAHFIPAIIIYLTSGFGVKDLEWLPSILKGIASIYILIVFVLASLKFLDAAQDVYNTYPYARERTIKGYIQLMKILVYTGGAIFFLAILLGQNPGSILTGLGALTAVLAFVFRDPILGFVASIQLAANKMVKQGDWITLPKNNIDGTVEDITLTSVKIQNWDKTFTTIPTYSLVSEPMINWVGMIESGGRRIQRSINIDITSIRFCDQSLIDKLKKVPHLGDFFHISESAIPEKNHLSIDHATNLSLYKKYLEFYCSSHPDIHENMTRMVRFLQSTERGLPVEITFFSKFQEVYAFESLHAEIFNHFLAILPYFELRVFQNPSGNGFPLNANFNPDYDHVKNRP